MHDAIGLGTTTQQQQFFRQKFCKGPSKTFDETTSRRLKHGSDNEVNGVATLCGKILPAFKSG